MKGYEEVEWLRARVAELEVQLQCAEKESCDYVTLLMQGEQVRERIMFDAILSGAFQKGN